MMGPSSTARGQRPRFSFHSFAPAAIQAGQYGDHQTRVKVDRTLQQHHALTFIARFHAFTITFIPESALSV
jgi:hypothetical protein